MNRTACSFLLSTIIQKGKSARPRSLKYINSFFFFFFFSNGQLWHTRRVWNPSGVSSQNWKRAHKNRKRRNPLATRGSDQILSLLVSHSSRVLLWPDWGLINRGCLFNASRSGVPGWRIWWSIVSTGGSFKGSAARAWEAGQNSFSLNDNKLLKRLQCLIHVGMWPEIKIAHCWLPLSRTWWQLGVVFAKQSL